MNNKTTPGDSIQDPLQSYGREELVALIGSQAEENQLLRDQAEHFEHLYLDIIHSTSWKLAWPIRAAFKVLSSIKAALKKIMQRQPRRIGMAAALGAVAPNAGFDSALSQLLMFKSSAEKPRINLLVSQPLSQACLQSILVPLAPIAVRKQVGLRVISLDPALTARHCQQIIRQLSLTEPLDFVFHGSGLAKSMRSPFRLEFGTREIVLSLTCAADLAMATMVPARQRLIMDPRTVGWTCQLEAILEPILTGGQR